MKKCHLAGQILGERIRVDRIKAVPIINFKKVAFCSVRIV